MTNRRLLCASPGYLARHGTPKAPGKKAPNLYKLTWDDKHVDEAFEIVAKGKKPMPAYGDKLKDKDIADLVAYLKANPAK